MTDKLILMGDKAYDSYKAWSGVEVFKGITQYTIQDIPIQESRYLFGDEVWLIGKNRRPWVFQYPTHIDTEALFTIVNYFIREDKP